MGFVTRDAKKLLSENKRYLHYIRHTDVAELKSFANQLKVSWPTVKGIMINLSKNNVISESPNDKKRKFRIKPEFGYSLGIAIGASQWKIVLIDYNFSTIDFNEDLEFIELKNALIERFGKSESDDCLCFNTPTTYTEIHDWCTDAINITIDFFSSLLNINLLSVGISLPGIIDNNTQCIVFCPNIPDLRGVELKKLIRSDVWKRIVEHDIPIAFCHDATAATVFEKEHLYFENNPEREYASLPNIATIYMGSGLSSGYIINNTLVYGASGACGEIGHLDLRCASIHDINCDKRDKQGKYLIDSKQDLLTRDKNGYDFKKNYEPNIDPTKHSCQCGRQNCLEHLIRVKVFNAINCSDFNKKTSDDELKTFASHHPYRYKVLKNFIGQILNVTINILNVDMIVFAGRVLNNMPELRRDLDSLKVGNALRSSANYCKIIEGSQRPEAVAIGAAIISTYKVLEENNDQFEISWKDY